jgi:hypothetical protein
VNPTRISVSLVSYARPWNIPIICRSLLSYGFEDIVVVDNWQDDGLLRTLFDDELRKKIHLVRTGSNIKTAARYPPHIDHMQNETIATVDDDYVVTAHGWDRLIDTWDGSKIVAQVPSGPQLHNAHRVPFLNLGYGSLFNRDWPLISYLYLVDGGLINISEWNQFADRIFTTFYGSWDAIEATDESLLRLKNYDGKLSETDGSAIHLKDGYWVSQWDLVMRVMVMRRQARSLMMRTDPSLSALQDRMEFLSRTGYGDYLLGNGI